MQMLGGIAEPDQGGVGDIGQPGRPLHRNFGGHPVGADRQVPAVLFAASQGDQDNIGFLEPFPDFQVSAVIEVVGFFIRLLLMLSSW